MINENEAPDADVDAPKPPKRRKKPAEKELDIPFEAALERLEQIVAQMESGNLSLDACMKCYEEGTRLRDYCSRSLKQYEQRIEILMKNANEGNNPAWENFDEQ